MEDKRKRGLGRGLSALLGNTPLATPAAEPSAIIDLKGTVQVPVAHMQSGRYQPRMEFDQEALEDLADSIRAKGIIQPILVRPLPEDTSRYEIIAGERRWRAAQMARLHEVPVLVRDFSDQEAAEVALIENLQRRDLSPLEEAEGYRRLIDDFSRTQEDLAQALGKSRSHVANMIRLLALPEPVKVYMRDGRLSAGHARALLNAEDPVVLAQQVVSKGLNVRQTEKLATDKGGVKARKPRPTTHEKDSDTLALERDLARVLGLKVEVEFRGRGGQVVIHYDTLDQLDDILYRLNNPSDRHRTSSQSDDGADSYDVDDFEADNAAFASSFARSPSSIPPAPMPQSHQVMAGSAAALGLQVKAEQDPAELVAALDQRAAENTDEADALVASFGGEEDLLEPLVVEPAHEPITVEDLTAETADDTEELIASFDDADNGEENSSDISLDDSADAWANELMAETSAEAEQLVAGIGADAAEDDGDLDISAILSTDDDEATAVVDDPALTDDVDAEAVLNALRSAAADDEASSDDAVEISLDESADAWADELMAETSAEAEQLVAGIGADAAEDDGDLDISAILSTDDDEATAVVDDPALTDDVDAEAVLNALRSAAADDEASSDISLDESADAWADELMAETSAEAEQLVAGIGADAAEDDGDLDISAILSADDDETTTVVDDPALTDDVDAEAVLNALRSAAADDDSSSDISLDESADAWADELMAETSAEAEQLVAGIGADAAEDDGDLDISAILSADDDEAPAPQTEAESTAEDAGLVDEAEAEAVLNALRAAADDADPLAALARLGAFSVEDDGEEADPEALFQASADAWADSLKGTSVGDTLNSDSELQALLSQIKENEKS